MTYIGNFLLEKYITLLVELSEKYLKFGTKEGEIYVLITCSY